MLNITPPLSEPSPLAPSGSETNTKESVSDAPAIPFQAIMAQMKLAAHRPGEASQAPDGLMASADNGSDDEGMRQESAAQSAPPQVPDVGALLPFFTQGMVATVASVPTQAQTTRAELNTTSIGLNQTSIGLNQTSIGLNQTSIGLNPTSAGLNPTSAGSGLTSTGGALSAAELKLKLLPLGQQMTLITSAQPTPNDASLSEFAQQQGLDAQTIRWLLTRNPGASSGVPVPPPATNGLPAANPPIRTLQLPPEWAATISGSGVAAPPAPAITDAVDALALAPTINATPSSMARTPLSHSMELDLTQDSSVDGSEWLKNWFMPRNTSAEVGTVLGPVDGLSPADQSALPLSLETSSQDSTDRGNPFSPSPTTSPPANEFRSELQKAQSQDTFLSRTLSTTGQDLADKMSQAIGKRLLESIEKGEWQLKINLKPVELGHIEVDLRMKDNALEARFSAQQGLTRDLIEGGLGRLKETLQHSGMDVASLRVNDGQSSRNGGDSTPRHAPSRGQETNAPRDSSSETEVTALPRIRLNTDGGLDLMV